ncbi:kinesin-domain-containing protein [Lactarius akahatsu]|uniref:Kinesin-domain-containing protein n=1 Tax=Lactarius akahatsu TaxID=416441 RepID=A0AAD4LD30_9AGAM|nr:kinesin-domain-containing protein [Lactarius akahatsu]
MVVPSGSITVAVRVRPPSSWEAARLPELIYDTTIRGDGALSMPERPSTSYSSVREIVQIVDDRILTFDPAEPDQAKAFAERGFIPPGTKRYKDRRFMFDRVFRPDSSQQEVYDATARPLLQRLLDGFNTTVFAYGATGCGKTHTISGTDSDPGTIYLTMADLFQRIEDRKDDYNAEVVVTFLEIYNEEIRDLLSEPGTPTPRGGLQIREDKSVKVVGLTELRPRTAEEVKDIVLMGNSRRTQSPTHANETSSRSHAVLQVQVTQAPRTASLTEERFMGTLSIIDLAGSERAAATTNMGQRMVEGANINKSLLALGNCINALCESGGAIRHVPYRNSKLTRLLKFSLGGNCKTVMIVCVAPTSIHFDDTHNTLIYAERATKIKTRVVTRNVVNVDRHVGQYVEAINRLNAEVTELKAKLAGKANSEGDILRRKKAEAQAEVERVKSDMQVRAEQMQVSIKDGALCSGKLSSAQTRLHAIRSRIQELDKQAGSSGGLTADLEAERGLLQALAAPEEDVLKPDSTLNARLQRSLNASNIFDAMLRAVTERRSDRLDEVSTENVKLDARWRKATMEKIRAEAERDAMKHAMAEQAKMLVDLLGMVGRYTVALGDTSRSLRTALEDGRDGLDGTARVVASSLRTLLEQNDEDFQSLVGHTVASYAATPGLSNAEGIKGLVRPKRVSSAPTELQPRTKSSRRSSTYGLLGVGSPLRKSHLKSPRKSLRNSFGGAGVPYRRPSDKGKEKKVVQWRDEAGQGDLDEAREPSILVYSESSTLLSTSVTPAPDDSSVFSAPACSSTVEGEWVDEKTDDSFRLSLSLPPRDQQTRIAAPRTRRGSRLDPGLLKSRGATTLGSLTEDNENGSESAVGRRPLSDRSFNSFALDPPSNSSSSSGNGTQRPPASSKVSEKHKPTSPVQRPPPTPRSAAALKVSRRRSNIGPLRMERARRRSSLRPPAHGDEEMYLGGSVSGTRRVPTVGVEPSLAARKSPAKKKRMSLLSLASKGMGHSNRLRPSTRTSLANVSSGDISSSVDMSSRMAKPTWR